MRYQPTLEERFWAKVEKTDGCWLWTAALSTTGYGRIGVGKKMAYTHRLSWEMHNGPIPPGMHICHHCDNPKCVRPDHLFLGTRTDNMRDMWRKGRGWSPWAARAEWTHCPKGHPYPEKKAANGWRYCTTCHKERTRERQQRKRHNEEAA